MELELLTKKVKKIRDKQKLKNLAGRVLLILVLVLSLFLIALSVVNLNINNQNQKLVRQGEQLKESIAKAKEIESQQVYLSSKLEAFKTLVSQQAKHQSVAEAIFSLIPDGTVLKGFDVSETGALILSGSVPDWPTFNLLASRIRQQADNKLLVEKAIVNKLAFSDKGEISFDINLQLIVP